MSMFVFFLAAFGLSACGSGLAGEPDIVREVEVQAPPTPTPTATPDPNATPAATPDSETSESITGLDLALADYDLGFDVFVQQCASCHGASDGVGPGLASMRDAASTRVEGLSAEEYVYQSIIDPGAFVVDGFSNSMPADFVTTLTTEEINSLVKFVVEFDPSSMMAGAADDTGDADSGAASDTTDADTGGAADTDTNPLPAGETMTVRGRLVSGTAEGKAIPADVPVELLLVDESAVLLDRYSTATNEDNSFVFDNVVREPTAVYALVADYDGVTQSHIFELGGSEEDVSQDITVYDRTTDRDSVTVTWIEMTVNYAPIEQFGIEVTLTMEIGNMGDRVVTSDETIQVDEDQEAYVSTLIELPPGAFHVQPMQRTGSNRYFVDSVDGVPVVKDTLPLFPGQVHNVSLLYFLPYEDGAVIDQSFGYPVLDSWVLVPNDTVQFASTQFDTEGFWCCRIADSGVRIEELDPDESIDPDRDYSLVKSHSLLAPTEADDHIVFELIGRPTRTIDLIATDPTTVTSSSGDGGTNTLPLMIGGFGALLIALAGVMWFMQRGQPKSRARAVEAWQPPRPNDKEALLRAISTLDDAYDAGLIDEDIYEERRAILSDLVVPLLDEED
jgi:mono/diheme cytochrome c family protein